MHALARTTGASTSGLQPYVTSADNDGVNWAAYQGGAQTFSDGPYRMKFDSVNRIIYSANWRAGLLALRVIDPVDAIQIAPGSSNKASVTPAKTFSAMAANFLFINNLALRSGTGLYDVKGRIMNAR